MKKGKNIFWGVLFVLGALALLVGRLGYLEGFGFWTILFSVGLAGIFIDGIYHRSFFMIFFSLAFLAILHDDLLGIQAVTPWPVLGAALLATIGLNIIFPKHERWRKYFVHKGWSKKDSEWNAQCSAEYADGEQVHFECSFGEAVKYVTSRELSLAVLENSFGSLTVYFDNAGLKNGMANINVHNSFGAMVLYVPANWKVIVNTSGGFGGVKEQGRCNPAGENCLHIAGEVAFGGLEIRYI